MNPRDGWVWFRAAGSRTLGLGDDRLLAAEGGKSSAEAMRLLPAGKHVVQAGHADAVTRYCQAIRAAGGEPVFYEMGWGKSDREAEGRGRIFELAVKNRIRLYAPCSTAWARVYRERPELALQHPQDSSHPGDLGHFLNLACFYAALTDETPVGKLPRTYHVWPHALPKPQTDAEKAAAAAELTKFQPDAYQAKLAKWMFRSMAANLTHTLDEPTARYLETVAWEEWQTIQRRLKEIMK